MNDMARSLSNTVMSQQSSAQTTLDNIRKTILSAGDSVDLEFADIVPETGHPVAISLADDPAVEGALPRITFNSQTQTLTARVMPTRVHDCHQFWIHQEIFNMVLTGFMTATEMEGLNISGGTTFDAFTGPYLNSMKQPGLCILPGNLPLPTVVVESGWSELWPRLVSDRDLWLIGGPAVEAVFLLRWTKIAGGRVKGDIQLHGRDAARNVVLIQEEPIFPAPLNAQNQRIHITMEQLFGSNLPPGRNSGNVYGLSIPNLRTKADGAIRAMGFAPA